MKKNKVFVLLIMAMLVLFGLACSAASAVGYVTAQGLNAITPPPSSTSASAGTPPPAEVVPTTPTAAALPDAGAGPAAEAQADEGQQPAAEAQPEESQAPAAEAQPGAAGAAGPEQSRTEYYRAVYDVCMYSAKEAGIARENAVHACQEFVRRSMDGKWFEAPSQGWEWPLPEGTAPGEGA